VAEPDAFVAAVAAALGHEHATATHSGRAAMAALFEHLALRHEDEIYITTTFNYPNVSACVTSTVFNYCKPSRVLTRHTRAIFIIHEFGVPHPATPELKARAQSRGIPLIEDCAHGIDSSGSGGWRVGSMGDWVVVSLPKIMPTVHGGLLLGPPVQYQAGARPLQEMRQALATAAAWWSAWPALAARRRAVFGDLSSRFGQLGLEPVFQVTEEITPWFFPVRLRDPEEVIRRVREQGVDCGQWHGTDILVFPCHQYMGERQVERISAAVSAALETLPSGG
jgi:dTDP-4-amino-4,6-dideoxygalactose transaminase